MYKIFSLLLIVFLTASCSFLQNKLPDTLPENYPSQYTMYGNTPDYDTEWWKEFGSDELNHLMEMAIQDNFNIIEAWARLEQARAQAAKSGSFLYPDVSADAGAAAAKQKSKGKDAVDTETYSLGLTVSYEVDLWGKIRSNRNSSDLLLKASREDVNTAIMSITSLIAETWVNIISAKRQEASLSKQLELNNKLLNIIEIRFQNGRANAIDIFQQQQSIAAIQAALIPLASQKKLYQHQLALLIGKHANYNTNLKQQTFPVITETPNAGIPSDLIAMRPDVRSAGLKLKSANWEIAAAKADRLPSLRLSASYTYSSDEVSTIFDNWLANLAANLTGPIFDAGRRKNEVKRVEAVVDERLANYQKTVLTAVKEVEDALVKEKFNRKELLAKQHQLDISQKTFNEAGNRYLNGLSDYLPVLREQLNIASFENSIIKENADIIISRIQLQKAIGGSWADDIEQNHKISQHK